MLLYTQINNKPSESNGHTTQLRGIASTQAVAAMDSCFVLVRTHQHGIARRKGLTEDH